MSGVQARAIVEEAVRRELFGPTTGGAREGAPLDISGGRVRFPNAESARGRFHDQATGEEIFKGTNPLSRYGAGVLFAGAQVRAHRNQPTEEQAVLGMTGVATAEDAMTQPPVQVDGYLRHEVPDSDDFDLGDANKSSPSAMALSFQCRLAPESTLEVELEGARYEKLIVQIGAEEKSRVWWVRRPFKMRGEISAASLLSDTYRLIDVPARMVDAEGPVPLALRFFSRRYSTGGAGDQRLVTVAVLNESQGAGAAAAVFQVGLTLAARRGAAFLPYPEVVLQDSDEEALSLALLYRKQRTFAIGHGCAADWGPVATDGSVSTISSAALPTYEVMSLSPDVYLRDEGGEYVRDNSGRRVQVSVSMDKLARGDREGNAQIELVLEQYEKWIDRCAAGVSKLAPRHRKAAETHVRLAREALTRMRVGWALVNENEVAGKAFRWANEAMLAQQVRAGFKLRTVSQGKDGFWQVEGSHPEPTVPDGRGYWRPFQIAFLLTVLPELVDPRRTERLNVDLIFFPTGGGKTEAYLGASAISLIARRLRNPDDAGTDTLMRYTLRLLTAQQFLRAAALVCVLEDIRERHADTLGSAPFGIGIWLGAGSTPNTWRSAVESLRSLRSRAHAQNAFLLLRCPWCGAQMGPQRKKGGGQEPVGYEQVGGRVILRCPDRECKYFVRRQGLPVHVVDEDIYAVRPSIVIGTVDKFAMMAWRPEARSIFGIGDNGERDASPPNLIVQDELHLISGPLGSMVGLYEPIIDELCTDRRGSNPIPPKIIASTATIRRYKSQVLGLFGRERVALFPPHGLEEGHSFFAEPATSEDGTPLPGRRYLGVLSSSLGSTQTVQVRVACATLQAATDIPEEHRDGYWTNLNFLNSLRELGNTVSLVQSDIPDHLTALRRRDGIVPRWPRRVMELTSRRRSDEIPKAIEQLQLSYKAGQGNQEAVDICLASNIIEVGIDIERLGLMTIVGQPKTTAQYIQVSGRVGRRPNVSPGLVIVVYGALKPRDRSHYERFRTYHQALYAQVEPTSVTPFATPVLRRALHAAAVAYVRQAAPVDLGPDPFPDHYYNQAIQLLQERAELADPAALPALAELADVRARQWMHWQRTEWDANPAPYGNPLEGLMRFAGTLPDLDSQATIWDVPTSMRNVDAECRLEVTQSYAVEDATLKEAT